MPRASIDLSWLAPLLTKTPQLQTNPNFQDETVPFVDPETGLDTTRLISKGTGVPFQQPSSWQRMIHPEASGVIDAQNARFTAAPIFAHQGNDLRKLIAAENYTGLPDWARIPGTTPQQAALMGQGNFQEPSAIAVENRAAENLKAGVPVVQSANDVQQANLNFAKTKGAVERQSVEEAILKQSDVNNLAKLLNVDAPTIELEAKRLQGELGRQPLYEEVRESVIRNQLSAAKNVVPVQQAQEKATAELGLEELGARKAAFPYTRVAMTNREIANAADSFGFSVGAPTVNRINPDGTVSALQRNPLGMSKIQEQMNSIGDLKSLAGGSDVDVIKLPSGQSVGIKKAPVVNTIDPLTGAGTTRTPIAKYPSHNGVAPPPPSEAQTTPVMDTIFDNTPSGSTIDLNSTTNIQKQIKSIDTQLADSELQTRAAMYPQFAEKIKQLQAERIRLKAQYDEIMKQNTRQLISRPAMNTLSFP